MVEAYKTEEADAEKSILWFDSYDKHIRNFILVNVKRSGKAVPLVFASPERAFGQMAQFMEKKFNRKVEVSSIPLPFLSLQRIDMTMDVPQRWRLGRVRKAQALGRNGQPVAEHHEVPDNMCDIYAWAGYSWPQPTVLTYQLDAWARDIYDLDLISQKVIEAFTMGDEVWIQVKHPEPFGYRIVPVLLQRIANNSQLEVQDGKERSLRRTFDIQVQGWIPREATVVKAVRRVDLQLAIWDEEDEEE